MSHELISFNHVLAERARTHIVRQRAEENLQAENVLNIDDYRKKPNFFDVLGSLYLKFIGARGSTNNLVEFESYRDSSHPTA